MSREPAAEPAPDHRSTLGQLERMGDRLAAALHPPQPSGWRRLPQRMRITPNSIITMADSASQVAAGDHPRRALRRRSGCPTSELIAAWKALRWRASLPDKVGRVTSRSHRRCISDYSGDHEFSVAVVEPPGPCRAHYRILLTERYRNLPQGLRACLPAPFRPRPHCAVGSGLRTGRRHLITRPKWGAVTTPALRAEDHPASRCTRGKVHRGRQRRTGRSYMGPDTVVLVSHRYDLIRFWNGATGSLQVSRTGNERLCICSSTRIAAGRSQRSRSRPYRSARISPPTSLLEAGNSIPEGGG